MKVATIVFEILSAGLAILTYLLVLRYNLHMLQLHGYKNDEQMNWLSEHPGKQALLYVSVPILLCTILFMNLPCFIVLTLYLWICVKYFGYLRIANTKKKLVFTMRVRRLVVTALFLAVLLLAGLYILGWKLTGMGLRFLVGGVLILFVMAPLWTLFANVVNKPIEKGVNNHYINDAKRILKQNKDLQIIGITGSYGKTSVKFYLETLLKERFRTLVTPESYNTPMGVVKTIRGSLKPTHEIFVCEMGARHVGDIKEITDIVHPHHGLITSVGPQHLETFGGIENVAATKFELADALPKGGLLFLNGDNEWITEKAKNYEAPIFYRNDSEGAGYRASDISLSSLGTEFTVTTPDGQQESFRTRLIGGHNVINIVGAISVAHTLGIPLKDLKVPVRRIQSVPHRMELKDHGNMTIIDDAFNSNPVGSKAAVETLKLFEGVRILITPGMVELGEQEEEYNYKFGTYAAACCDYILLVGINRTKPIMQGALDSGFAEEKCQAFRKLEEAMQFAHSISDAGHKYILLENDLPDCY
ncbi:MAG: UDP-N-acetylmuramoyl-tripeptide--D-alanyl-D-alanine ligase [Lachnospiraceae bacterium]|nr:UDP-N-acetylmuramoyl-tripeptide--D-alanyl-D-alanine ligase [Lachnospiraceae bacterium]